VPLSLQHLQNIGAGNIGAKQSVAIDLADVGDLVTDGHYLFHSS
jgi:hypothetical protein